MKIVRYGTVKVSSGPISVEGWLVQREDTDPAEATTEQLLLAVATDWALTQLKIALAQAQAVAFHKMVKREAGKQVLPEKVN